MTLRFYCVSLHRGIFRVSQLWFSACKRALRLKVDLRFLLALKNWLSRKTIWVKLLQFVLCMYLYMWMYLFIHICSVVVRHTVGSLTFFEVCTATLSLSLGNKIAHTNGNGVCCCSCIFFTVFFFLRRTMKYWPIIQKGFWFAYT